MNFLLKGAPVSCHVSGKEDKPQRPNNTGSIGDTPRSQQANPSRCVCVDWVFVSTSALRFGVRVLESVPFLGWCEQSSPFGSGRLPSLHSPQEMLGHRLPPSCVKGKEFHFEHLLTCSNGRKPPLVPQNPRGPAAGLALKNQSFAHFPDPEVMENRAPLVLVVDFTGFIILP